MKKSFARLICVMLACMMLASVAVVTASAADSSTIAAADNLWNSGNGPTQSRKAHSVKESPKTDHNYCVSPLFEVKAGDVITVGPVLIDQGYIITAYKSNGSSYENAKHKEENDPDCKREFILNNVAILTYTVPADENVTHMMITNSQMFIDCTLVTKNNPFDKQGYYDFMDAQGVNIDIVRPTCNVEDGSQLTNLFTECETIDGNGYKNGSEPTRYKSVKKRAFNAGDFVYFAAAYQSQSYQMGLWNDDTALTSVNKNYMVLYEDLGNGYAIYAYRIRPDANQATIILQKGDCDAGIALATVNQPFTGDVYRKLFNISTSDETSDSDSPLNGLTGLFMGDSISAGNLDNKTSYKTSYWGKAWAGRIAQLTGLKATNASVSGAKASKCDNWLFNQHLDHVGKQFDIIVMQGGVNDARGSITVGEPKPLSSSEAVLEGATGTYIGGLQWLFHNIKAKFPDSTLFFIANHRLDGHEKGRAQDMSEYFDTAEQLCEMYGINFIDLYNNKELNDALMTDTTTYLPDTLHLNSEGYDIIAPYIIEALEAVLAPEETPEETTPVETPDETTPTETPEQTTPTEAPDETTPTETTPAGDDDNNGGCGSSVALSAMSMLALISLSGVVILKKNK